MELNHVRIACTGFAANRARTAPLTVFERTRRPRENRIRGNSTNLVNLTPRDSTIASMRALAMPASIPSATRVPSSAETQAWRISATLTVFKLETDSDFHLVLSDTSGATMIAEIPSPSCDAGSVWSTPLRRLLLYPSRSARLRRRRGSNPGRGSPR
jgi:hypothetical protein